MQELYNITKMVSRMEKLTFTKLLKIGDKIEYKNWRRITPLPTISNFFQELFWTEGNTKLMLNLERNRKDSDQVDHAVSIFLYYETS